MEGEGEGAAVMIVHRMTALVTLVGAQQTKCESHVRGGPTEWGEGEEERGGGPCRR